MRVVFFGNAPLFSLPFAEALARCDGVKLVGVVSPPMKGTSERRARLLAAHALARLPSFAFERLVKGRERLALQMTRVGVANGAPVLRPLTMCAPGVIDEIAAWRPDLVVMAGFDRILRPALLKRLPEVWNVHPSLLPKHKGPLPEFWTLEHGDATAGVTIHHVTAGIDEGDLVAQAPVDLDAHVTGAGLRQRCATVGAALLREVVARRARGEVLRQPQRGIGTYEPKPARTDLLAPFEEGAQRVFDRARAASPWTGVEVTVPAAWWSTSSREPAQASHDATPDRVRIRLCGPSPLFLVAHHAPGTIVRAGPGFVLACSDGAVKFASAEVDTTALPAARTAKVQAQSIAAA